MLTATLPTYSLKIRPARVSDIDVLVELLAQLFSIEEDFAIDTRKQQKGLLTLLMKEQDSCVLVAQVQDKIVGMCTAQVVISTAEGGRVGWVEDMVVAPEYRGRGIGRCLLHTLELWAKSENLKRLQLLADAENHGAHVFYKKQGWRPTRMAAWRKREEDLG